MADRTHGDVDLPIEQAFDSHRRLLWGIGYRLTGSAADADDVVQQTFMRALERPPRTLERGWGPWLVAVAVNLGRDVLRRRRRLRYVGVWLPTPVKTDDPEPLVPEPADPGHDPGARYSLYESASLAFLVALEALTPSQRAVLLLREVLEYSASETGACLAMSVSNVRVTHHRARRALTEYDRRRRQPSADRLRAHGEQLARLLACLQAGDSRGVEALLAEDAETLTDGGGVVQAALRPVRGRDKVARLYLARAARVGPPARGEFCSVNGLPAWLAEWPPAPHRPARALLQCELDRDDRIRELYSILNPAKLAAL